ncbi:hypothetical protein [Paracoccus aestuariivivens]|uniref:Beta-lactamase n=1 Tax=Paracoccus aestuariivivens TaxID=1820333 RepID=A0A6L6JGC8_9RHOB|nr:hypothetical protein [Paracoccus aestuariivivens]MTH80258.1 hypothetical protein [Paracoccus aestuariivivens]
MRVATFRSALLLALSILCLPPAARAEAVPQPIGTRQICGEGAILDAPGGQVMARLPRGAQVVVRDFGLGGDGRGHYRIDAPTGYVAMEDAPHFCVPPNEGAFRAPPNTCHLIAASRRTLPEVNAFALEHATFLPTMSVYRASNGWHAISLGIVSLAAAEILLERGEGLPDDSYCADGRNYIAALDLQDGAFFDPEGRPDAQCLTGDAMACAARAEAIASRADLSQADNFDAFRIWMLACMAGATEACGRPAILTSATYDHPMHTALPGADDRIGIRRDLMRRGCDVGVAESCLDLAGREMQVHTDTPPEYLTALQAMTAGCMTGNDYACRDMFRLMERREKVMATPVAAEDWYQAALLRAATCRPDPTAGDEYSCRPVYRAYTAFVEIAADGDPRVAQARNYLAAGCAAGNTDACPAPPQDAEFRRLALICRTQDTPDGAQACSGALAAYARDVSVTEIEPLVAMLEGACGPTRFAGCATLAFVYSSHTLTGQDLTFIGKDQPDRRLQALETGCRPGLLGLPNCRDLAKTLDRRGAVERAAEVYATACATIRAESEVAVYARGNGACFEAGLLDLRQRHDLPAARAYFDYVCNDPHQSDARYACKHLGLMARDAGEPDEAFVLFRRACYPTQEERGDGEGCLLYGDALRANRDRITLDDSPPMLGPPVSGDGIGVETLASHAYATGCLSRWEASCAANRLAIDAVLAAADAAPVVPCALHTQDGSVLADCSCRHLRFFETTEVAFGKRELVASDLYIWPDGDRSLVQEQGGNWRLNGVGAFSHFEEDETRCLTRDDTGTVLCVTVPFP